MKKTILLLLGVLLLCTCAGVPAAENPTDTLVIGSFVIDFPDGFFNEEPRTFTSGLTITIRDVTRDSSFKVVTHDRGYFWFVAKGSDSYELASFRYDYESGSRRKFVLASEIGYKFTTVPRSVLYLGNLRLYMRQPQKPDPIAYGKRQLVEWKFAAAWDSRFVTDEVRELLKTTEGGSAWTQLAMVTPQDREKSAAAAATRRPRDSPSGVAVDSAGNVYFADAANHRVRKIDVNGRISTVAGTGVIGTDGDGGPALSARLSYPRSLALDASGNLYVADPPAHRVRMVSPDGVITTAAGRGELGSWGDEGPADAAYLSDPFGIALDGLGNLYIADSSNNRIRRVDTRGIITTVAGSGRAGGGGDGGAALSAALNHPMDVAVDQAGNLYIADQNNHRVRRVSANGTIATVPGGESGSPVCLTVDTSGILYVSYSDRKSIRRIDPAGAEETITDSSASGIAQIGGPTDILVTADGSLYVADPVLDIILKVDAAGGFSRLDWQ